jgi:hypothetical protein
MHYPAVPLQQEQQQGHQMEQQNQQRNLPVPPPPQQQEQHSTSDTVMQQRFDDQVWQQKNLPVQNQQHPATCTCVRDGYILLHAIVQFPFLSHSATALPHGMIWDLHVVSP